MDPETYLEKIGYSPLPIDTFDQIITKYPDDPKIQEGIRLDQLVCETHGSKSYSRLLRFVYSTEIPDLGITWAEMVTRSSGLALERATLPVIGDFCEGSHRILEVGCGEGILMGYLAVRYQNSQVVAVDVLSEALESSRAKILRLGLRNVRLLRGKATALRKMYRGRFDRIIARNVYGVLTDLQNPRATAQELRFLTRHLSPGGMMWVSKCFDGPEPVEAFNEIIEHHADLCVKDREQIPYEFADDGKCMKGHCAWVVTT